MKANASTSTTFEIEEYKSQKKLSLQQLFMPQFRYQLLLEKVFSYYNQSCVNKENQIDFANKSIFIYNYKKRKNLNENKRKPNSVKNLFSDKDYRNWILNNPIDNKKNIIELLEDISNAYLISKLVKENLEKIFFKEIKELFNIQGKIGQLIGLFPDNSFIYLPNLFLKNLC